MESKISFYLQKNLLLSGENIDRTLKKEVN